jgi:hypothetical protein
MSRRCCVAESPARCGDGAALRFWRVTHRACDLPLQELTHYDEAIADFKAALVGRAHASATCPRTSGLCGGGFPQAIDKNAPEAKDRIKRCEELKQTAKKVRTTRPAARCSVRARQIRIVHACVPHSLLWSGCTSACECDASPLTALAAACIAAAAH